MTRSVRMIAVLAALGFAAGCTSKEDASCPSGQERCQGFCRDPASYATDAANCGACGVACGFGTCVAGACRCEGGTLCPGQTPRCSVLTADRLNCGACGNVCARPNEGCAGGTCGCIEPFPDDCVSYCTNFQTDAANCSGCGNVCPLTNGCCAGGTCAPQTEHSNGIGVPGLGQSFYDCVPLGTYDLTQALKAAQAWTPSGLSKPGAEIDGCSSDCIGWQTAHGACGTWCYGNDALRGRAILVQGIACSCPTTGPQPNWN